MPPHCDTMDGPVVTAARRALEKGDVSLILPWAHKGAEGEIRKAFDRAMKARRLGREAAELADLWFFETVVRLHREGEGAAYTGLKPAGLDVGPVIPRVERALDKGDPREVVEFLQHVLAEQVEHRFHRAIETKGYDRRDVDAAREHVQAFLGLTLYSHHLYTSMTGAAEHAGEGGEGGGGGHEHGKEGGGGHGHGGGHRH